MISGNYFYMPEGEPIFNMAVDNLLLEKAANRDWQEEPVLRLYSWQFPAITIGYNQFPEKVLDIPNIPQDLPVIRRVTGGRAIYHDQSEITFSFSMSIDSLPTELRSLSATNRLIAETVSQVLLDAGIKAEWARESDGNFHRHEGRTGACFNSISKYEITFGGKKIVGGAQRRRGNAFIHQGSIKVNGIQEHKGIGQTALSNFPLNENKYNITDFRESFPLRFGKNWGIVFGEKRFGDDYQSEAAKFATILAASPLRK
jgi:lipoate-protein ligase A